MFREQLGEDTTIWSNVLTAIQNINTELETSTRLRKQYQSVCAEYDKQYAVLQYIRQAANRTTEIYKDVKGFVEDKKRLNLDNLNNAIMMAGEVVPDADLRGVFIALKDDQARVLNPRGQDLNIREGSAFRASMSLFIRHTLIKADPHALQCLLLDELFATSSDITASNLREYLDDYSKDVVIVGIEQQMSVFESLKTQQYYVHKGENRISTVHLIK